MSNIIELLKNNKRFQYITILSVIALFCIVLNITFSAFTRTTNKNAANIKVGNLSYTINGTEAFTIKANKNDITKNTITLLNLTDLDTKYEMTYDVYSDENLNSKIDKPAGLAVEYSSLTPSAVKGTINKAGTRIIRLVITNDTENDYYVQLGVNSGFAYNALEYKDDITKEYIEDDLYIAAIIDGEISNSFPTTNNYTPKVVCNNGASGHVTWDGEKWNFNLSSPVTKSETRCNAYFTNGTQYLKDAIMTNNASIVVNDASTLTNQPGKAINTESEKFLVKTLDDYGDSYIFRGNIDNNYVIFANKCWKIVRITGNNAIKLVLQNSNGTDCSVYKPLGNIPFNTAPAIFNTPKGVGFMYGEPDEGTFEEVQANTYDSTILASLKSWYFSAFTENEKNMLADVIWCNDKSLATGNGVSATAGTTYASYVRIYANNDISNAAPSLVCPSAGDDGKLSKFTASDTTNGNGKLKGVTGLGNMEYKVGLLTVDEAAFAGGAFNVINNSYYLFENNMAWYYLLSPSRFTTSKKANI